MEAFDMINIAAYYTRPMSRPSAENNARYLDAAELARTQAVWEAEYTSTRFSRLHEVALSDVPRISARLRFDQWSGHTAVDGDMTGSVELVCQRCLRPMRYPFDEHFTLVLVGAGEEAVQVPEAYETVVLETPQLDAQWLVEEQLLLALPLIPKHEDEAECNALPSVPERNPQASEEADTALKRQRPFQNLRELLRKD